MQLHNIVSELLAPKGSQGVFKEKQSKNDPSGLEALNMASFMPPQALAERPQPVKEIPPEAITNKQIVMLDFLKQLHMKCGVKPEELVQAMKGLPAQQLKRPPEQTMEMVLGRLNISPDKLGVARKLYEEMLAGTARADALQAKGQKGLNGQKNQKNQKGQAEQAVALVNANKISAAPAAVEKSGGVVEKSSTQVAGKPSAAAAGELSQNPAPSSAQSPAQSLTQSLKTPNPMLQMNGGIYGKFQAKNETGVAVPGQVIQQMRQQVTKNGVTQNEVANAAVTKTDMTKPDVTKADAKSTVAATNAEVKPNPRLSPATAADGQGHDGLDSHEDGSQKDADSASTYNANAAGATAVPNNSSLAKATQIGNATAAATGIHHEDMSANIQRLLQNAQILISKGGGEVKVQLHPDGLGQVHLKVHLHQGLVQVEMMTNNQDAKKILEAGMHDLRSQLSAHSLRLDTIKIGMAHEMSLDSRQQPQQQQQNNSTFQFQQEAQREFAQNFMNGFNDGSRSRQESMFDMFPAPPSRPRPARTTIDSVAKGRRRNGRLNLIA